MIWKPHKKQEQALKSSAFEILFGGARSGGKTEAGIMWLLYDKNNSKYRALVIRKNATDMNDWTARARSVYEKVGAIYVGGEFRFPSGATIVLGHLKDDQAFTKYQGHEYHKVLIEELTQIASEELYMKLISSCRSTVDGLKPQIFCTSNPDGVGRFWVKRRFIEGHTPSIPFRDEISGRTRVFIPATVEDNPTIIEKDPDYVKYLESLPPDLKAQWRYGSWDYTIIKGAIYGSDMIQAQKEHRICFVPLLPYQDVHAVWDIGLSDKMVCWLFQVQGLEVRMIDLIDGDNKEWGYYVQVLRERGYAYGTMFLPHDASKRDPKSLQSFDQFLKDNRFKTYTIERPKSVLNVIQRTRTIFPRLFFDSVKCGDGVRALEAYRRKWDDIRNMYSDEPYHDWTSHYCLSGDTRIKLTRGETRIDKVIVGDLVDLDGVKGKVTASVCTGIKDLVLLEFSNGTKIKTTKQHKIFTNTGLVTADALSYNHVIHTDNNYLWKLSDFKYKGIREGIISLIRKSNIDYGKAERKLFRKLTIGNCFCIERFGKTLTVKYLKLKNWFAKTVTILTLPLRIGKKDLKAQEEMYYQNTLIKSSMEANTTKLKQDTLIIKSLENTYTEWFGVILMERLKKVMKYIILTKTKPTTILQTSSLYLEATTQNYMQKLINGSGVTQIKNNYCQHKLKLKNGMGQKKAKLGTQYMESKLGQTERKLQNYVVYVKSLMEHITLKDLSIVGASAKVRLIKKTIIKAERTYDLTIEKHHCYYANGVLVSNCDSVGLLESALRILLTETQTFNQSSSEIQYSAYGEPL